MLDAGVKNHQLKSLSTPPTKIAALFFYQALTHFSYATHATHLLS